MQNYPQYSSKQKWNHWLTLILIVLTFLLVLFKVTLSHYLGGMFTIYLLHKSFGVLIFVITLWRFTIIKAEGVPNVLPKNQKLQRILSKSIQGFIYIFLIIVPLSGYLMSSRSLNFFCIISIPAIDMSNMFYDFFHIMHKFSSYLLAILLILHIAGALYHYFWIKDKVLQSMLNRN
ncbi:MAG: cytochrome b/b6 domain-containing protein [Gilliamella sp.]|uniref:cytochrome b n=1 Tax=Gilliamella sp. TaxID=1891236 RepID=UPI00262EE8D0|nr:cytochrome b/b6 domain-containing protein [Gilliamella sp.]MCO6551450.1 cytochrome b/b6 domain-containing protein [Gilliamella sp.]MCO6560414.1 cytochrome b/b6 domain-containing protein [Gilliamella sp.]